MERLVAFVCRASSLALGAGIFLLGAAVVLSGTYLLLPSFLERRAADSIREDLDLGSTPGVELEEGTLLEVLAGKFSGGRVTMMGVQLGGLRAEEVVVDLAPLNLDLVGSVLGGRVQSEEPLSGTFRGTLSEEEVLRVVRAGADAPVRDLELEEGGVLVGTEASVLGLTVPVSVRGNLILRGESLVFEPQRASVRGTDMPPEITQRELAGADLSYPLEGLPYGAELSGIQVEENRLVLSGEMRRIQLGDSG